MNNANLFERVSKYHRDVNLSKCEPYMKAGSLRDRRGFLYEEGVDEIEGLYKGFIILSNGPNFAKKLIRDRVVLAPSSVPEMERLFMDISSEGDVIDYIQGQRSPDGAYIFDRTNGRVARVQVLNNNPALPDNFNIDEVLPDNLLSSDGNVPVGRNIGCKTFIGAILPYAYDDTEAVQLKKTSYGKLGMGKAVWFRRGDMQEYFLDSEESDSGGLNGSELSKDEFDIYEFHRRWERSNEGMELTEEFKQFVKNNGSSDSSGVSLRI